MAGPIKANIWYTLSYEVSAKDKFIAKPFISDTWGAFVRPTGLFLYPMSMPQRPSVIIIDNAGNYLTISGLDKKNNAYVAADMDQLFDSPILIGHLEEIKSFEVSGIQHYFSGIGTNLPSENDLLKSLKKMVESAVKLMGDIPYRHYSFMSIGKGNGGIEQTNSTAFALDGTAYNDSAVRQKTLNFLTHEYFHNFNVKRIRPIELGPFDYSTENRTNLLWVSEGLTVYFEDIILNRAGLKPRNEMLRDWARIIETYENNPGRKFQTLAESSYQTWEDGPFGVKGKTISYYEKGPIIGMLLDLRIRLATSNNSSLIDVMRTLYHKYYKEEKRGFTEKEFSELCENIAGINLHEIFDYVYTLDEIRYHDYFEAAGLLLAKSGTKDGRVKIELTLLSELSALQKRITDDLLRDN